MLSETLVALAHSSNSSISANLIVSFGASTAGGDATFTDGMEVELAGDRGVEDVSAALPIPATARADDALAGARLFFDGLPFDALAPPLGMFNCARIDAAQSADADIRRPNDTGSADGTDGGAASSGAFVVPAMFLPASRAAAMDVGEQNGVLVAAGSDFVSSGI